MSTETGRPTPEEIQRYVDGRLDASAAARLEAWLEHSPALRDEVGDYRRITALLHTAFDPILDEPVPARLATIPRTRWRRRLGTLAAGIAWAGVGAVVATALGFGWSSLTDRHEHETESLAHLAAYAHTVYVPEVMHPVEVGARDRDHLVNWLSNRLGVPVPAPPLDHAGFALLGGRLLPADDGPAAQLMYEAPDGTRVTLYVHHQEHEAHDTAFRFAEEDGVKVFYWIESKLGYAVTGEMDRAALHDVANAAYRGLHP